MELDTVVIHERISTLQKKVDGNAKFVVGAAAVIATFVTVLQVVPPVITAVTNPAAQTVLQK